MTKQQPRDPQEALSDLRLAIREANEALNALRDATRDAARSIDKRVAAISSATDQLIGEAVNKGLDDYKETLDRAIRDATASVYRRFDTIASLLLEGDPHAPKQPPFEELVRQHLRSRCNCGAFGEEIPHALTCPVRKILGGA